MSGPAKHVRKNRWFWESGSDSYQRRHGEVLTRQAMAWGVWRIPESTVHALGEVAGLDVLELGCGAAQWSVAIARRGARPVGLDISAEQLRHAASARGRLRVPLLQGDAEALPFGDARFDLVFCDHGAMSFADPRRTVPEAARVLRPGGRLVFCTDTPFHFLCWDGDAERVDERLHGDYFSMRTGEDEATVQFQLPYGEWIRLFRANGLEVEDLIELRPQEDATTTYDDYVPIEWARRWPAEQIWRARRAGPPGATRSDTLAT